MSYLYFRRIATVFAFAFLLYSCDIKGESVAPPPQTDLQPKRIEDDLQLNPAPLQPKEAEQNLSPSEVWDVSETDVSEIDFSRKFIAFTFDDAPSRTMENIFAVYADFNDKNPDCIACATVFFNGRLIDKQSEHLLYAAHTLGFELGNHTFSHADLTKLSMEDVEAEIKKTDELIKKADGKAYHLIRAPFGNVNDAVKKCAPTPLIDWTIDTLDWTGVSADDIFKSVFSNRFPGAIVLMHDGYQNTVEALKKLLPVLKEDGYQVVSVSQLSKLHNCPLIRGKVYIRARKKTGAGTR